MAMEEREAAEARATLAWRRRLIWGLLLVICVTAAARVASASRKEATRATAPDGGTSLMPTTTETGQPAEPEPTGFQRILPFITEGALALLIGLFAGMATRMLAKLVVFGLLFFVLFTQFLAYKGFITLDWGRFWHWMKDFILNMPDQTGWRTLVQYKLPSAGAFLIGYFLGLKRG